MKVMTLNVCHSGPDSAHAIAAAILANDVDVALLTEFKVGTGGDRLLSALAAGGLTEIIAGPPGAGAYPYTVAIASRLPAEAAALPLDGLQEAASLAEVVVGGISITAAYFPLGDLHVPFWQTRFLPYTTTRMDRPALVAGDWNTGRRAIDISTRPVPGEAEFAAFSSSGWVDAWRAVHADEREHSFVSPAGNGFRLDHAFLSPSLAPRLLGADYIHATREKGVSDHSALLVSLARQGEGG
jgi:exodeoxyribonuclease III